VTRIRIAGLRAGCTGALPRLAISGRTIVIADARGSRGLADLGGPVQMFRRRAAGRRRRCRACWAAVGASSAIGIAWSLAAIELVRSVQVLDVREAGSGRGPQILWFTPAGFGEQPEQHHDQCWGQEGDQPGDGEPLAGVGHRAECDQAGDRAQHACRERPARH
jgi:hypothetical protein